MNRKSTTFLMTTAILATTAALSGVAAIYFAGPVINQAAFADEHKVLICHIPPDDPTNRHEILVNSHAVKAHVSNHGDYHGPCNDGDDDDDNDGDDNGDGLD